jgi:drug/metabolite transporter (DMT)-like permease
LPVVTAALTGVQVGASMVATRFVIDQTAPASLALLRYTIGVVCLLPPVLLGRQLRIAPRDIAPIALLGIVQFGILIALLNLGLRTVPAGRAALIFALFPLLAMLIAAALGHERLSAAKTAGVLLTIGGVALALGEAAIQASSDWRGELAVLAATACGAACAVLYRPYLRRYPALPVSALAMLASVGALALLAAGEGFYAQLPRFTPGGWAAVLFIGTASGAGYYIWLWTLRHTTPTRASAFQALSPITALLLGALLLGEPVTSAMLAGLALVVLGLMLAHRP